jgi:ABC-type Fe3+-hydroxamate transport system substrate-binding protein
MTDPTETNPTEATDGPDERARRLVDDLGAEVAVPVDVRRVVSLVPSLTEAIATVDRALLVGATDWCTHPADLDVVRVRGTKNPDVRRIVDLAPDLVVANMEENRELDVRRLREAGVAVWVTRIETVAEALASMSRLIRDALGRDEPQWLVEASQLWAEPAAPSGIRVAIPIWRDPWFVVGPRTYAHDLITRAGLTNAFADATERYPKVPLEAITGAEVDVVLLPDEPYEFGPDDGPEAMTARTALIPGRALTWYGPTLLTAREDILRPTRAAIEDA